jgi:hypothetical protein
VGVPRVVEEKPHHGLNSELPVELGVEGRTVEFPAEDEVRHPARLTISGRREMREHRVRPLDAQTDGGVEVGR